MDYESPQVLTRLKGKYDDLLLASKEKDLFGAIEHHDDLLLIVTSQEYGTFFEGLGKCVTSRNFNIPGEEDRTINAFNFIVHAQANMLNALQGMIPSIYRGHFRGRAYIGNLGALESAINILLEMTKEVDLTYGDN